MPAIKVGDVVAKQGPGRERWEVVEIQGTQAKIKLLAQSKKDGQPVDLGQFDTVPLTTLVLLESKSK